MEWISRFGTPQVLLSDQGTNFMSHLITQLCSLLKIEKSMSAGYHPQCNRRIEPTSNQRLNNFLIELSLTKPKMYNLPFKGLFNHTTPEFYISLVHNLINTPPSL